MFVCLVFFIFFDVDAVGAASAAAAYLPPVFSNFLIIIFYDSMSRMSLNHHAEKNILISSLFEASHPSKSKIYGHLLLQNDTYARSEGLLTPVNFRKYWTLYSRKESNLPSCIDPISQYLTNRHLQDLASRALISLSTLLISGLIPLRTSRSASHAHPSLLDSTPPARMPVIC